MAPPNRSPASEESPTAIHAPVAPPPSPAPASLGATAASGDRCAACGSLLGGDQRYCLECGERRGAARFNPRPTTTTTTVTTTRGPRSAPRMSGGTTLIAGVGTLLLAMGIGVLIGRSGSPAGTSGNSKVQVVQVPGGSGAASTAAAPGAALSGASARAATAKHRKSKRKSKSKSAPASTTHLSAANATQTVKNLPPPTVTVGAKGSGPGYTKGHFTGTFFGP